MNIEVTNIKWSINDEELPTNLVLEEVDLDGFEDVEEFLGMVFYEEYKLEPISYDYQLENKMKKEMFPFQDYKAQWVEIVKNAIEEDGEDAIEMGYDEQLQLLPLCKNLHDLYKVNEEFGWWDINNYQEMRKLVSFE